MPRKKQAGVPLGDGRYAYGDDIYAAFKCRKCGGVFIALVSSPGTVLCPFCGSNLLDPYDLQLLIESKKIRKEREEEE